MSGRHRSTPSDVDSLTAVIPSLAMPCCTSAFSFLWCFVGWAKMKPLPRTILVWCVVTDLAGPTCRAGMAMTCSRHLFLLLCQWPGGIISSSSIFSLLGFMKMLSPARLATARRFFSSLKIGCRTAWRLALASAYVFPVDFSTYNWYSTCTDLERTNLNCILLFASCFSFCQNSSTCSLSTCKYTDRHLFIDIQRNTTPIIMLFEALLNILYYIFYLHLQDIVYLFIFYYVQIQSFSTFLYTFQVHKT